MIVRGMIPSGQTLQVSVMINLPGYMIYEGFHKWENTPFIAGRCVEWKIVTEKNG
jgi:hypothetical protein